MIWILLLYHDTLLRYCKMIILPSTRGDGAWLSCLQEHVQSCCRVVVAKGNQESSESFCCGSGEVRCYNQSHSEEDIVCLLPVSLTGWCCQVWSTARQWCLSTIHNASSLSPYSYHVPHANAAFFTTDKMADGWSYPVLCNSFCYLSLLFIHELCIHIPLWFWGKLLFTLHVHLSTCGRAHWRQDVSGKHSLGVWQLLI